MFSFASVANRERRLGMLPSANRWDILKTRWKIPHKRVKCISLLKGLKKRAGIPAEMSTRAIFYCSKNIKKRIETCGNESSAQDKAKRVRQMQL